MKLIDNPATLSTPFKYDSYKGTPIVGHHTSIPYPSGYNLALLERFYEKLGMGHGASKIEVLGYRRGNETY